VGVTTARSLPPGKTRYPLYRRLGGSQGQSGQVQKVSPPTEIRFRERLAHSLSLYRLSYPTHNRDEGTFKYCTSELDGKKHAISDPTTTAADEQSSEIIIPTTGKRYNPGEHVWRALRQYNFKPGDYIQSSSVITP